MNTKKTIDIIAAFVLVGLIVLIAVFSYKVLNLENNYGITKSTNQQFDRFQVAIKQLNPSDSISLVEVSECLQSSISEIKSLDDEIDLKYELLIRSKQEESYMLKVLSGFIAIFLSVLGFFGYKTFKDIEDKADKFLEEKVGEIERKAEKAATSKIESLNGQIEDKVARSVAKYIDANLDKLVKTKFDEALVSLNDQFDNFKESIGDRIDIRVNKSNSEDSNMSKNEENQDESSQIEDSLSITLFDGEDEETRRKLLEGLSQNPQS